MQQKRTVSEKNIRMHAQTGRNNAPAVRRLEWRFLPDTRHPPVHARRHDRRQEAFRFESPVPLALTKNMLNRRVFVRRRILPVKIQVYFRGCS